MTNEDGFDDSADDEDDEDRPFEDTEDEDDTELEDQLFGEDQAGTPSGGPRLHFSADGRPQSLELEDRTVLVSGSSHSLITNLTLADLDLLEKARESPSIRDWLASENISRSTIFSDAFDAFFLLLVKADPQVSAVPTPGQTYLLLLLTELVAQQEFEELAAQCTGQPERAALVGQTWVDALHTVLTQEDLSAYASMCSVGAELQLVLDDLQQFLSRANCNRTDGPPPEGADTAPEDTAEPDQAACPHCGGIHAAPEAPAPKTAAQMGLTAEEARKRLSGLLDEFSRLQAELRELLEKRRDRLEEISRALGRLGIRDGQSTLSGLGQALQLAGTLPGKAEKIGMEEALELSLRYRDDPQLRAILQQLGRMHKMARAVMSATTKDVENAARKPLQKGNDLSRLLPQEAMSSRHEKLRPGFKKRLVERDLDVYDTLGKAPLGRGPIVVCKDTSGSMAGQPNVWASAMYLAMSFIAGQQRRSCALINFSGPGQVAVTEFDREASAVAHVDAASFMFNGGTCFETPLKKALELISNSRFNRADVLFMTDGAGNISAALMESFRQTKKARGFQLVAILINVGLADRGIVDGFADRTLLLSDLQQDADVLNTVFAL